MRMLYRCRSCGSNATVELTCDYCGAGTRQQPRSEKVSDHIGLHDYMALSAGLVVGIALVLLMLSMEVPA